MTGTDLEENLEQLAYEKQLIDGYGLNMGDPQVLAGKGGEKEDE